MKRSALVFVFLAAISVSTSAYAAPSQNEEGSTATTNVTSTTEPHGSLNESNSGAITEELPQIEPDP